MFLFQTGKTIQFFSSDQVPRILAVEGNTDQLIPETRDPLKAATYKTNKKYGFEFRRRKKLTHFYNSGHVASSNRISPDTYLYGKMHTSEHKRWNDQFSHHQTISNLINTNLHIIRR